MLNFDNPSLLTITLLQNNFFVISGRVIDIHFSALGLGEGAGKGEMESDPFEGG